MRAYRPKLPITSVRAEVFGVHTHVGVWINHAKSGTLVVRNEELKGLLHILFNVEGEQKTFVERDAYMLEVVCGSMVREVPKDDDQVLTEDNEIQTIGEILGKL